MALIETRLSDAVSAFTHGGETLLESYGSNATVFFGKGAVVVVDPFVAPRQAAALGARIAARTPDPVTHVVLTHHHTDHALGASFFAAHGADVIAHAAAARRMFCVRSSKEGRARLAAPSARRRWPARRSSPRHR